MYYNNSDKKGFTLLEILIVVALILLIALALLLLLRPKIQIGKAWDAKRKSDLNKLSKIFEDYYNDKNCYPKPNEVCTDNPIYYPDDNIYGCKICGNNFDPYMQELPCDPENPRKYYLYTFDNETCPSKYVIYTNLSIVDDPDSQAIGCRGGGCGPAPGYSYAKNSPNTEIQINTCAESPGPFYCLDPNNNCNNCGSTFEECLNNNTCNLDAGIYGGIGGSNCTKRCSY